MRLARPSTIRNMEYIYDINMLIKKNLITKIYFKNSVSAVYRVKTFIR